MSGIKLPAIERPNGKLYRPRKIDAISLGNEDEITHILVFGMHDIECAKANAQREMDRLSNEFYYGDMRLEISGPGKRVWRRRDLIRFEDDQPLYGYAEDPVNGRAAVMFSVDEIEVER